MLATADLVRGFDEGCSFVDHLPYAHHLEGVFLNVDGSVGQVWELVLPEAEAADEARLEEIAAGISGFAGRLAEGAHFQLILWADSDLTGALEAYEKLSAADPDPIVDRIVAEKVRHIRESRGGFWPGTAELFAPRRLRAFMTVRTFPRWSAPSKGRLAAGFFGGEDKLEGDLVREWAAIRREFAKVAGMIESGLGALKFRFAVLDGQGLTDLLYRQLNPSRARRVGAPALGRGFIRDQVLFNAPLARGEGFVLDGQATRVVTLRELPQATVPGMFAACGAFMDIFPSTMVVMNWIVPDQGAALRRLKFQKSFALVQQGAAGSDVSEEARQKKEELSGLITDIFRTGRAIIQARVHVVFCGEDTTRLEAACDGLMASLHRAGAEGLREEIIAPSLFLTCLPLNYDQRFERYIRRERRILSDNFADMVPLFGAMQGTATPAALYLNRRGEPVGVDFFDSETNPHGVIIGASGAGKSFFTNDLIFQNYRLGAHFFVLDKGHSYRKTCAILGGQYIHFDLKAPLTINPFAGRPGEGNLAFLVEVLSLMASGGDERDRLLREEKGFLQKAVLAAYAAVKGREVTLSDVVDALDGEMGARLALRLAPFTAGGQYGRFFDGPNAFEVDRRFTVFELAELGAYPDLQLVVLLNIMFFVTRFVAAEHLRAQRKFFLIDEAWQLLKMANTADFIANAFKTFRKYRCAALAVTQEVGDLLQQPSGQAIMANAANKVFLKQEAALIERLRRELDLPPAAAALLRSVATVKGRYSEALVLAGGSAGVVRLVPDPFLYWAATSDPRDNALLDAARERFDGELLPALEHCAATRPLGAGELAVRSTS